MKKSTAVMTEPVKPTFDHLEAFEPLEEIVTTTPVVERRITKVKAKRTADAELITIEYEVAHEKAKDGWFSATFASKEEPREEFYNSMDKLLPLLISAVGLDSDQWEEGQVIGVSFKHTEDNIGITITGKCEINGSYPCPTSPYAIAQDNFDYNLVTALQQEAIAYLDGARRQLSLF